MIFAVDISKNRTVQLIADGVEIENNGYGAMLVKFYKKVDNLEARDKNGHIYADFNARLTVGAYYIDRIKGYRIVSGLSDEEFVALNREGIYASMGYELTDEDEGGEEVPV